MDSIQTLYFDQAAVRGETVLLEDALNAALASQALPEPVRRLAGEMTAAALLAAAAVNIDGSVILQVFGDGPVKILAVEVRADRSFRTTATLAPGAEIPESADMKALVNANGRGRCALILDLANRNPDEQPYQGVVPLEGDNFAQALENYFAASEQVETVIRLACDGRKAGGVMVQKLPSEGGVLPENFDAEGWSRIRMFTETVKPEELLGLAPEELNRRLFWEESPRVTGETDVEFRCSCGEHALQRVIASLSDEDLSHILEEGDFEMTCRFCGRTYTCTKEDVLAMRQAMKAGEKRPS